MGEDAGVNERYFEKKAEFSFRRGGKQRSWIGSHIISCARTTDSRYFVLISIVWGVRHGIKGVMDGPDAI